MAIRIGSNIASLQAQRRLSETSSTLSKTYERLSTGQRINKASDDAAGLAIADSLKANSALFNIAQRNINDALSASNIMDSALAQQQTILNRLSELAEQSANGVYADNQRTALNKEYRALVQEMNRISATTTFNGIKLLAGKRDGNQSELSMQAGTDGGIDSAISLAAADTGFMSGSVAFQQSADEIITSNDTVYFRQNLSSLDSISALCGGSIATTNVTDSGGMEREVYVAFLWGYANPARDSFRILPYAFYSNASGGYSECSIQLPPAFGLQESPNIKTSLNLTFQDSGATATLGIDLSALSLSQASNGPVNKSAVDFSGVETVLRAKDALTTISNRRSELSLIQSQIGALQSRFEAALAVTSSSGINARAAESRIRDSDIAEESAGLVRIQIAQQVASSILAQANQAPAMALDLLRAA